MTADTDTKPAIDDSAWEASLEGGAALSEDALVVDVNGFEGPLDLLLALARTQKVDLSQISVLALAEQYLVFVEEAQKLKLELAADYLVMAAWLAFLKSRLLLPRDDEDGEQVTAEELAKRLAFRLQRLDAMRDAIAKLMTRKRLGRDVFPRGMPDGFRQVRTTTFSAQIYDLLKAYAAQRQRGLSAVHTIKARKVWSVEESRALLQRLLGGHIGGWVQLDMFLEQYFSAPEDEVRTARASSFGATLEMAREGLVELRQDVPFGPLYLRKRTADGDRFGAWERVG